MTKWIAGYGDGNFSEYKYYLASNNIYPNTFCLKLNNSIMINDVDLKVLKEAFPEATITNHVLKNLNKTSCVEDDDYSDFYDVENYVNIFDKKTFYIIRQNMIIVYSDGGNGEELCNNLLKLLPQTIETPKSSEVRLVAYSNYYYTIKSKIEKTHINVDECYNDDFKEVDKNIRNFLSLRKSGLIVLRGQIGSGKTYYIRNLITEVPKKYIIVTTAMASHLSSPEFISFMMDNKDSVFILEDCEQILLDRTENTFASAVTNILNMSDGLLSDIFNIKFICTFNADISKIDPALTRKGRCFANYEFKLLCKEKTEELLKKRGIKSDSVEEMSLAEIYNYEQKDNVKQKTKRIGF